MMLRQRFHMALRIAIVEMEMSMKTTLLAKVNTSGNGGCPGLHLAEDGTIIALGPQTDARTFGQMPNVLPGELAVGGIDPDVIVRAADELRRRGLA
jgi:hypothetical protein